MKSTGISCIILLGVLFSTTLQAQENGSVGIGIENPNPNAILHLVSPGSNQGLLIPTMTTSQRNSSFFTGKLSNSDNGLLVFDLTDKTFYYWQDSGWQSLSAGNQSLEYDPLTNQLTLSGGSSIDLSALATTDWNDLKNTPEGFLDGTDEVDDADADPTNEIQDLSISGNLLRITNNDNATVIDLGAISGSDNQDLSFINGVISLTGDPDATMIDLSGYDSDVSDDFDGQFSNLTGVPADLADGDQVDDADADPTNEIQSLELVDNILTLSGDLSGTSLNFAGWDMDVTDDFDGQFSSLTGVPADLVDGDQVDDADADPTNELQMITTNSSPGNITLSGDKTLNLNVNDADASSTNELITMTSLLAGNTLRIVESGTNHDVDLSALAEDADADPNNEVQSLIYNSVSNVLTLTKPSGVHDMWDLSELDDATPWIEENSGTNINYTGKYVISNNMISRTNPSHVTGADLMATIGALKAEMINSHRTVVVVPGVGTNLRNIDAGISGQELILMVIGPGSLNVDGANGNIFLSSASHTLTSGSTLHLMYFKDQSSGTNFDGWMEVGVSIAAGR
tara:strand:- start:3278 stop:4987 length:1710 start_codon:yes stop_codon:yes gene_type:complete